ncbi:MAG: alpha/beta hydrolase-fold protein, partial [Reichenbachiella sp.]
FDGKAWTEIKTNIPDPYWHDPVNSLEEYWAQIRLYANVKSRYQTLFENPAQTPEYGKVVQVPNFKSQHVVSRNVDVWLPPNYNEDNAYPVIYMHDGQMLFDGASTWNGQEWNIDEVVTHLMMENKIPPVIIVGVWNTGRTRHSEYYPQKPLKLLPTSLRDTLVSRNLAGKPQADQYLNFLVKELKPEIDQKFATLTKAEDTYIMGSSMGGLISMYAMCEYPDVFGGAGCLSTHWVGDPNIQGTEIIKSFAQYLDENLPTANDHKFYFDHGTVGLDGLYEPGQAMVDKIMQSHGFDDMSWMTKKFEGADHSEKSWNERLHIPLQFLLKK